MITVAVLQPGYLPWLGFFGQLRRADSFVYYDDVCPQLHGDFVPCSSALDLWLNCGDEARCVLQAGVPA